VPYDRLQGAGSPSIGTRRQAGTSPLVTTRQDFGPDLDDEGKRSIGEDRKQAAVRLREFFGIEGGDPLVVLDLQMHRFTKLRKHAMNWPRSSANSANSLGVLSPA
jgi:hypothetical protein